mmetsp:Transcript_48759/g.105026  ORF Transcript_48759/g.105026 Transcript_48759/m.105026 type:complete len:129 (+) Transcript_48759:180-566(+)
MLVTKFGPTRPPFFPLLQMERRHWSTVGPLWSSSFLFAFLAPLASLAALLARIILLILSNFLFLFVRVISEGRHSAARVIVLTFLWGAVRRTSWQNRAVLSVAVLLMFVFKCLSFLPGSSEEGAVRKL